MVAPLPEDETAAMIERLVSEYFPAECDMTAAGESVKPASSAGSDIVPSASNNATLQIAEFAGNVFDKTINRHSHQANCIIGATAPSLYREKERITAALLANILGGPATNSILNSVLREQNGWVYNVECNYSQYADTGIMAVCFGCDRDRLEDCVRVIDNEFHKLCETLLSDEKLKEAKKQFEGQLAISSENSESQALSMCKSLNAFGTVQDDDAVRRKIDAVTAADLQRAASDILSPDRLSKLIYL